MGAAFLSEAWCEAVAPLIVGADLGVAITGVVEHVVPGAPDGDARVVLELSEGVVAAVGTQTRPDVDVSLTLPYADAAAVLDGSLDPSVAFMQGRLKTSGRPGLVLDLLVAADREALDALRARLASLDG
jgi:hypothetical protein